MNKIKQTLKFLYIFLFEYPYSFIMSLLNIHKYREIKNLCLFIGYPRSGHSLVGAFIDAHENAIISQELDFLKYFNLRFKKKQLFYLIITNSKKLAKKGRINTGYDYSVKNSMQGNFTNLYVIGDKKGDQSVKWLIKKNNLNDLEFFLPVKFIHVIRNPYDTIATMKKWQKTESFEVAFNSYYENVIFINNLKNTKKHNILDVYFEDVVRNTKKELIKICSFLNITYSQSYLTSCTKIVNPVINKSRKRADYSSFEIKKIENLINSIQFLKHYKYDD